MVDFEEKPRKVHLYRDRTGQTYKGRGGKEREYAHTLCAGNFASKALLTTDDPRKVTCQTCQRHIIQGTEGAGRHQIRRDRNPEQLIDQMAKDARDLERWLEQEQAMADKMYALSVFLFGQLGENEDAICLTSPMFTVGDVAQGQFARYREHRDSRESRWSHE